MTDETYRARARRARLTWYASVSPVVTVLVLIALPMVLAVPKARAALALAQESQFDAAYQQLSWIAGHDLVEQWRADYDLGTIRVMQGKGWAGVDLLERALNGAPESHRCAVQDNLALALDDSSSHGTSEANRYSVWADMVDAGDPVPAEADGMSSSDLRARAQELRHEAQAAGIEAQGFRDDTTCHEPQNDPPPPPAPSQNPTAPPTQGTSQDDQEEQERQEELEERQKEADADAEEQRQSGEGALGPSDGSGGGDSGGGDSGDGSGGSPPNW